MTDKNNGGPAFPLATSSGSNTAVNGMTLRDYFAAKAMQALLSTCSVSKQGYNTELTRRAAQAYAMADEMLAAREAV